MGYLAHIVYIHSFHTELATGYFFMEISGTKTGFWFLLKMKDLVDGGNHSFTAKIG